MSAPRPTSTLADPPGGCGPAWERPGARPAARGEALIDERAFSKLRWRCRRGLLENDLFIERFFARYAPDLTEGQAQGLLRLMDLSDNDLLDLLLARCEPQGELSHDDDAVRVLRMMRAPARPEMSVQRDILDSETSGVIPFSKSRKSS